MKKSILFLIVLIPSICMLQAQDIMVTGTVLDDQGIVLPGANVVIKGTAKGATTNFDGEYTIDVTDGCYFGVFLFRLR